jgi:hypothetical protein
MFTRKENNGTAVDAVTPKRRFSRQGDTIAMTLDAFKPKRRFSRSGGDTDTTAAEGAISKTTSPRKAFLKSLFRRGSVTKPVEMIEGVQFPEPARESAPSSVLETAPSTPERVEKTDLVISDEVVEVLQVVEVVEVMPSPEAPVNDESAVPLATNVYEDDNTGSKKEDCCAQECVIL